MQPADKPQFVATLEGLAAIKPCKGLTPEALEVYWLALQAWPLEAFKLAAAHLASAEEFMPNPWHFDQLRKAALRAPAEAWELARKAAGSAIQLGQVTDRCFSGEELIDRAVAAIGGYGVIAMSDTKGLQFLSQRFVDRYEELKAVDEVRKALPQIAGPIANGDVRSVVSSLSRSKAVRR